MLPFLLSQGWQSMKKVKKRAWNIFVIPFRSGWGSKRRGQQLKKAFLCDSRRRPGPAIQIILYTRKLLEASKEVLVWNTSTPSAHNSQLGRLEKTPDQLSGKTKQNTENKLSTGFGPVAPTIQQNINPSLFQAIRFIVSMYFLHPGQSVSVVFRCFFFRSALRSAVSTASGHSGDRRLGVRLLLLSESVSWSLEFSERKPRSAGV